MADKKISELTELQDSSVVNNGVDNDDYLIIVDDSETLIDEKNKKIKVSTLHEYLASLNSPTFTGFPLVPTAPLGNITTRIANTLFVRNEIDEVINYIDTEILATTTLINNEITDVSNNTDTKIAEIKLDNIQDVIASNLTVADNNKYLSYNFTNNNFELIDKPGVSINNLVKIQDVGGIPGLPTLDASNLTNITIPTGAGAPLTTKGDVYIYGTTFERLPVGTNGTALVADSTTATGLSWKQPKSDNLQQFASAQSVNFSLFDSFHGQLIRINTNASNITVTLATTGIREGFQAILFNAGTNDVIINPNGEIILSRGLNLININSACSIVYNATTSTWFAIGDLS
jgi:hypothetical protein